MPRKPPMPKPKKSTVSRTGRSADAMAGAATAKKATAERKATGQSKSSAMDAVTRRYKTSTRSSMVKGQGVGTWSDNSAVPVVKTLTKDRLTGKTRVTGSKSYPKKGK